MLGYQRKKDNITRNTKLIEGRGFDLTYFSDIHVRINDKVDLWLSTNTWHLKNQKSESKCLVEMLNFLDDEPEVEEDIESKYLAALMEIVDLKEMIKEAK